MTVTDTRSDWAERAACRQLADPSIFMPARADSPDAILAAAHCRACPVTAACYADAAQFGRATGTVQGAHYWADGKPHTIRSLDAPASTLSRSQRAAIRRREAVTRWYALLEQGHSAAACHETVAREYAVSTGSVREWVRVTRTERQQRDEARGGDA